MKNRFFYNRAGFTLLEILLVVAAIAILAGIIIIAINPAKQLAETRNAQRHSDLRAVLDAVHQYKIDNGEVASTTIRVGSNCESTANAEICALPTGNCQGLTDLGMLTEDEIYLVEIPTDPTNATSGGAGYRIIQSNTGRITVCAPFAEQGTTISVSR